MNRRPGEGAPSWAQKGPENHAVQLATLPAQGASETEKKPESRYIHQPKMKPEKTLLKTTPAKWEGGRGAVRAPGFAPSDPFPPSDKCKVLYYSSLSVS